VAIDAIYFRDPSAQYNMKYIKRELIKAYIGFYSQGQSHSTSFPIATGNWGCGAYNGDKQLKGRHLFQTFISHTYLYSDHSINGCFRGYSSVNICSIW